jgi:phage terminase large subunit
MDMVANTDLERWQQIAELCKDDPKLFARSVLGATLDPWQERALDAVVSKKRATIAGCNGAGKDAFLAMAGLWALSCRPNVRGLVTGPSLPQLMRVVQSEFQLWLSKSPLLQQIIQIDATMIAWRQKTGKRQQRTEPPQAFIKAVTAGARYSADGSGEIAAEGLQGTHGEHVIILVTEASGINDANWDAAESSCTRPDNIMIAVGNPLRRSGRFFESHTAPGFSRWHRECVPYTESSWADRTLMEDWIERYGADSVFCQVRCFGQFPAEGATDTAIPWNAVELAMTRSQPVGEYSGSAGLQLGVDCARYGDDESVIAVRRGAVIEPLRCFRKLSGPQLVGHVIQAVFESIPGDEVPDTRVELPSMSNDEREARRVYRARRECMIVVDEAGLGGSGVVDPLIQVHKFKRVIGVNNAWTADDVKRYESWDDEQWMETFPKFLAVGTLPRDRVLEAQLTVRKYEFTGKNESQRRLESKEKLRKRSKNSPDRAEAVVMACANNKKIRAATGGLQMYVIDTGVSMSGFRDPDGRIRR